MASKITSVRIDPELLDQIAESAKAAGVTKNAWIVSACEDRLTRKGGLVELVKRAASETTGGDLKPIGRAEPRITTSGLHTAPRFKCPRDCNPTWRPTSANIRCPVCRRETVPA